MNPSIPAEFENHRLLLFYKGDISALTLFTQQANGSVCFPQALPALSSALDEDAVAPGNVSLHPAMLVTSLNRILRLDSDLLQAEAGYQALIDTPRGIMTVYQAVDFISPASPIDSLSWKRDYLIRYCF